LVADAQLPVKFHPFDYKSFAIESLRIELDSVMRVFIDEMGEVHCILIVDGDKVLMWKKKGSEI
tara:strand:- start:235 stop:426 length:192 start_codon:yes stop_codon:yes gene_type:complete